MTPSNVPIVRAVEGQFHISCIQALVTGGRDLSGEIACGITRWRF
jgi:hypothetical protein